MSPAWGRMREERSPRDLGSFVAPLLPLRIGAQLLEKPLLVTSPSFGNRSLNAELHMEAMLGSARWQQVSISLVREGGSSTKCREHARKHHSLHRFNAWKNECRSLGKLE